jgi:hypothetical protein
MKFFALLSFFMNFVAELIVIADVRFVSCGRALVLCVKCWAGFAVDCQVLEHVSCCVCNVGCCMRRLVEGLLLGCEGEFLF